jgi:hypothetical protein
MYYEDGNSYGGGDPLWEIVELLKKYGARYTHELNDAVVSQELTVEREKEIAELVGRFYKERNMDLIRLYMDDDVTYRSEWVTEPLEGIEKLADYFKTKFTAMEREGNNLSYYVHPLHFRRTHFVILKQEIDPDEVLVEISFRRGKLSYFHLYPFKELPHSFINTSESFYRASNENRPHDS